MAAYLESREGINLKEISQLIKLSTKRVITYQAFKLKSWKSEVLQKMWKQM